MVAMLFSFVFVTSLVFTFTTSHNATYPYPYGVTWVLGNSANPSQLEPAGEGPYGTLYVARVQVDGEWVPGKGYFRGRTFVAAVSFLGRVIKSADCQTLLRGGTKWVPLQKNSQISDDAVLAGYDPRTHERTYVCRGFIFAEGRPWLTVGKVLENYNVCRIPFDGEKSSNSFEVLEYSWSGKNHI
ncbi:hypothetical protein Ocin01_15661 [Orchesella cincta]|uniref:Uncharacterized protein n=1 Tax=Orchesella cincta TaxID=48709 RepID=A0A1D2MDJ2_ORCCI|nr:hypothetical protein Ocin01_15661 [Orchesella cincta]